MAINCNNYPNRRTHTGELQLEFLRKQNTDLQSAMRASNEKQKEGDRIFVPFVIIFLRFHRFPSFFFT